MDRLRREKILARAYGVISRMHGDEGDLRESERAAAHAELHLAAMQIELELLVAEAGAKRQALKRGPTLRLVHSQ